MAPETFPSSARLRQLIYLRSDGEYHFNANERAGYICPMSMPERLRQAVVKRFGPMSKSMERQLQTRETMVDELERRGYRVRGQTDEQIVQVIRNGAWGIE